MPLVRLSSRLFITVSWVCGCAGLLDLSGCAHMVEGRVINAFNESLKKGDLALLREETTEDFQRKALDHDQALASLKAIDVPQGKTKVLKVENEGDDQKKVVVEVGESKRKVLFLLKRGEDSKKWEIDDIYLTRNKREMNAQKSVSEQVTLLSSVREFLEAWESGDRTQVLSVVTPEFRHSLAELPATSLAQLSKRLTAEVSEQKSLRPNMQIAEDTATVKLPKLSGEMQLKFRREGLRWRVDDISVESRRDGETMNSVRLAAAATSAAWEFLKTYQADQKSDLARLCTTKFYEGSLAFGDLKSVPLPLPEEDKAELEIKLEGHAANYIIRTPQEVVKLTLLKQDSDKINAPVRYLVDEVTLFEKQGTQDKRLSALFTSQAVMRLFAEALVNRDLEQLRLNSTSDFNKRVWERIHKAMLRELPLAEVHEGQPEVLATMFQGPVTQITVNQGEGPLTYVLREQGGKILMDDVLVPVADRPESIKTTFDLMIPILDFAAGFRTGNVELLRANSARDFSQFVWNVTNTIPTLPFDPQKQFRQPLRKVNITGDRAWITLGTEQFGARVELHKERDRYTVNDVELISGPEPQQRTWLKRTLRTVLAQDQQKLLKPLGN